MGSGGEREEVSYEGMRWEEGQRGQMVQDCLSVFEDYSERETTEKFFFLREEDILFFAEIYKIRIEAEKLR